MTETIIQLQDVDLVTFFGVNNSNFHIIRDLYPRLEISSRGPIIRVKGAKSIVKEFEQTVTQLQKHCKCHSSLSEEEINKIINGNPPTLVPQSEVITFGVKGNPIIARTPNQDLLVKSYEKNDLIFAIGPAGSGKTYIAIALAVRALKNKEIKKIILSRPAVEAGENLGFLPGDLKDKIDPYLQPLYDALLDMIPEAKLQYYMEKNIIQIAPLAYMRGRTLGDAIVILDEAQNTTTRQLKMFLTRMGKSSKYIITGDISQIDLPHRQQSGLIQALHILKGIKGVSYTYFDVNDIVRHRLVKEIVQAYNKEEEVVGSKKDNKK